VSVETQPCAREGSAGGTAEGGALRWLADAARERASRGLVRSLRVRAAGEDAVDLASNDYLGLARDPRVVAGAVAAARTWGAGATGSRLVSGTTGLHLELETELAAFTGAESGLVFASGYAANLAAVTALSGPGSLVVSDAGSHASLVDACRLSRARIVVTPSRDVGAVEAALSERSEARAVVLTDTIASGDGQAAPLTELYAACRRHDAVLIADEAHALGVVGPGGRGLVSATGLAGATDLVVTATLSKALGAQGGVVLASPAVRDHLVNTGRSFIFDTALAPTAAGAALAALRLVAADPGLAAAALARTRDVERLAARAGLPATPSASAVLGIVLGTADRATSAAALCADHGVLVGCFRPPSVPPGSSRLRVCGRADLGPRDLERVAAAFADVAATIAGTAAARV